LKGKLCVWFDQINGSVGLIFGKYLVNLLNNTLKIAVPVRHLMGFCPGSGELDGGRTWILALELLPGQDLGDGL